MMTHKINLYCLIVVLITPTLQCISVLGPRVLRPYSSYTVAVAGGSRAHNLYVAVEGRRANGQQFTQGQEVQVQAATSRHIEFNISDPGPGQYALIARSTSGPQFSSSAPLVYQSRSFCVFMQTDRRVYNPGDTINLRVIALDKYLLPLSGTVDVSVIDAGGTPVQQWATVPLDRGIFANQFVLADEPALGQWTIQVEARGQTYSRQILVADYVMPKFQMDMQMPKELLFSEGRFNINVTANHFNGLPVRGELTISAYAVFFSGLLQPVFSSPSRKVVEFNGNAQVPYDLKTDLDFAEDAARPLVIEAVLEEKDTLVRQNVSSRILLLRTPYRLKVSAPEYFKPNLPYKIQIEVADPLGEIMKVDGDVTVERHWDDGAPPNVTSVTLSDGIGSYTLIPDEGHVNSTLNVQINYKEVSERVVNVRSSKASGNQYLSVELLSRDTTVGDEMRARITATEPMDLVHYVIIGRGDIVLAKTLELNPSRRSVDISIQVTAKMAPGCVLIAWYPRLDALRNPLVAASVYAPQRNFLQHKVTVSPVAATSYRPNSLVELSVNGESGGHAAILAADNDAIVAGIADPNGLGSGLDMHTIEREVESFSGLKHSVFKNEDHLPSMGVDLGGLNTADVFHNSGVIILTDGVVIQHEKDDSKQPEVETATRAPLAGPYAFSRLPPPPSPRYYLTVTPQPTWTFANFSLGFDGRGSIDRRTPSSSVELTVGAFAVDPNFGLGVAPPRSFAVMVPMSMTAELPETMQRGESLAAVVVLKSTLTVETSVEVTFYNSDQYFEFEPLDNNVDSAKKIELFRRLRVTVPAQGSASTAFLVTVVRAGMASVLIEASGNGVSASLSRTIDVKDGYEEEVSSWQLLDARRGIARGNVTLNAMAGTRLGPALLLATGDLLAAAMYETAASSSQPAASPPQALQPMALACILLDYLQATNQEDTAQVTEARKQVNIGFQRLMAYRRKDGSFVPYIDSDLEEGDVLMTAMSCRWVSRCARHVTASPEAGAAAARWLAERQARDGGWPAPAPATATSPTDQLPIALASHALLALIQAKGTDIQFKSAIDAAAAYVSAGLSPFLPAHSLALAAHALAAARHPQARLALQMMDQYVNSTDSTVFWSRKLSGSEWRNPWLKGNSLEASTAAHGLRALLQAQLLDAAEPVARFLLGATRPQHPDPDVVDAIAEYGETIKTSTKLRISVNVTGSEETRQFQIMDSDAFVVKSQQVRNGRSASAVTEGRGVCALGLRAGGGTNVTAAWPRYTLDPRVDHVSTNHRLQLSICIGFVPQGNETESGLTLLTVQLPTGYLADIHTLTELTAARHVVRARLGALGARVYAWVRTTRGERCATLAAPRRLPAARQRPAWATLQDLYDSSHRARVFYQAVSSSACDVCREWASCARACGAVASQRSASDTDSASSNSGEGSRSAPDAAVATHASYLFVLGIAIACLVMR